MQITQISVEGLFGIFDHVIPLNIDERITIIHGLNGFGKSNILRMLDGLLNSKYSALINVPFNNFKVYFDDKSILEVEKENIESTDDKQENIVFKFYRDGLEKVSFYPDKDYKNIDWSKITNISNIIDSEEVIKKVTYSLQKLKQLKNRGLITNHTFQKKEIELLDYALVGFSKDPDLLNDIRKKIHIRLIESQRLLDVNNKDSSTMLPTVSTYSQELAKLMRDKFAEYGKESQSLDRSFPIRAVQQQHSSDLTDEQLKEQLNELEDTRNHLTELGLLDKDENVDFPTQLQDIYDSTRNILSVYVEDTKKKLNIFNNIASKIELLKTIINRKFAYSYKEMNFSKEQGFVFTTCYPNSSESDSKTISPTDLSSGEQHELVLLYELLFKVEPNSLVLIDEPELSLHVGWQSQFLKDLQEITALADLDILMATHSPDIIQDHWDDLTVELKAPGK